MTIDGGINAGDKLNTTACDETNVTQQFFVDAQHLRSKIKPELVMSYKVYPGPIEIQYATMQPEADSNYYQRFNVSPAKRIVNKRYGGDMCAKGNGVNQMLTADKNVCIAESSENWYTDHKGRIHWANDYNLCVSYNGDVNGWRSTITLRQCNDDYNQRWSIDGNQVHLQSYPQKVLHGHLDKFQSYDSGLGAAQDMYEIIDNYREISPNGEGPVAAYRFDGSFAEANGGQIITKVSGTTRYLQGRNGVGNSIYLSNAKLEIADNATIRNKHYTVSVWFNPSKSNQEWTGLVGKPGRNMNIWLHSNNFIHHRFKNNQSTNGGIADTAKDSIVRNQWNHVVITNDGFMARTYINGTLASEGIAGGDQLVENNMMILGSNLDGYSGNNFQGRMDDLEIYDVALTAAEIYNLHQTQQ
ncbi:MAG: hypothetical protein HRT35_38050 [Algicola sp.]|nr:hypothetical protein [Algicola sp.]